MSEMPLLLILFMMLWYSQMAFQISKQFLFLSMAFRAIEGLRFRFFR